MWIIPGLVVFVYHACLYFVVFTVPVEEISLLLPGTILSFCYCQSTKMGCLGCCDDNEGYCSCALACLGRRRRPHSPRTLSPTQAPEQPSRSSVVATTARQANPLAKRDEQVSQPTVSAEPQAVRPASTGESSSSRGKPQKPSGRPAITPVILVAPARRDHSPQVTSTGSTKAGTSNLAASKSPQSPQTISTSQLTVSPPGLGGTKQQPGRVAGEARSGPPPKAPASSRPSRSPRLVAGGSVVPSRITSCLSAAESSSASSSSYPESELQCMRLGIESEFYLAALDPKNNAATIEGFVEQLASNHNKVVGDKYCQMHHILDHHDMSHDYTKWNMVTEPTMELKIAPPCKLILF